VATNLHIIYLKIKEVSMKRKNLFFIILVIVVGLILVISCSKEAAKKDESKKDEVKAPTVKISTNSWIGWAPLYLAIEKDLFHEESGFKVNVELVRIDDTGTIKNSMIAGRVDGYAVSVDNFALNVTEGVPGKIVLCFDESHGGDGIVAKKEIKTIKDLKGKSVAVQLGLPGHFLLLHLLKQNGLTPNDFNVINMDSDKSGAAFTSGKLDAAVTWEPWLSKSEEAANGHILASTRELPGLIVDTLVLRENVLKDDKIVSTIINGWFKALEYWNNHKEESESIMAKSYNLDVETFNGMCSGVKFYNKEMNLKYFGETSEQKGPIYDIFKSAGELWKEAGISQTVIGPDEKIEPKFLRNLK
jgi:NitT/TauT family transport system substrate-binding protein